MTARLTAESTGIDGVTTVARQASRDGRGSFTRLFCSHELAAAGWTRPVAQVNQSITASAGALRGLHVQLRPFSEMKLVTCLSGSVFDVAVDLRRGSRTFLQHRHAILSAENGRALLIPEGCAHGFQALTDDVMLLYLHTAHHVLDAEAGVSPFDPRLAIAWPMPVTAISPRDQDLPCLPADFSGLES